jgi:rhodanese-related sulfurtransferase
MAASTSIKRMMPRRAFVGLGLVSVAAAGVWWVRAHPRFDGTHLDAAAAYRQAEGGAIILIDIRRPDEWRATGIGVGAHPIDMRRRDFIAALEAVVGADRQVPVALICARGVRSARLARQLSEAGFARIADVPEGMLGSSSGPGWLARKLPTRSYSEASS